jgi:Fic family protein
MNILMHGIPHGACIAMKIEAFGSGRTGTLVPVAGGREVTHAFAPDPLPPKWPWPVSLWPLLLEAHKALASLDGTGKHLPNPTLVLRPLQNREAQRSSSLEGTFTEPRQQALFELDPTYPESADDPLNANREVFNYARALRHWRDRKHALPLSLRLVRDLHGILMDGVRGSDKQPGEFRRHQNQIGRPARFVPPPPERLPAQLDQLEKHLHAERFIDGLVDAFVVHYQFEAIHPFMDGNGRVGRLLLAILIQEWCGLSDQWLYMSAYFDQNKDEYMHLLFRVSSEGAWEEWVRFCLTGVVETARDTLRRCESLLELHRGFHARLRQGNGSVRLAAIVDDLFVTPVAVVTSVADRQDVTYPTARSDLKRLHAAGILEPLEQSAKIAYFCPRILDVTYAD